MEIMTKSFLKFFHEKQRGVGQGQTCKSGKNPEKISRKIKKNGLEKYSVFFRLVRPAYRPVRIDPAVPAGVFHDQGNGERPGFHPYDIGKQPGSVLLLLVRSPLERPLHHLFDPVQHALHVRDKALALRAGGDMDAELGDLDRCAHAADYADIEVIAGRNRKRVAGRLAVLHELGVDELVAARRADSRDDENIGKIGDILGGIEIFYFGIACRTWARDSCLHGLMHRSCRGRS